MRLRLPYGLPGRFLLLLVSILVTLLLVELGLRLFLPQDLIRLPNEIWARDPVLDWRYAPNLNLPVNTGERTVRLVTDGNGYRVHSTTPEDADGRILMVGDSFLAAFQIDYDDTFAARLGQAASTSRGQTVEVVIAGTGGWDPNHYGLVAARELQRGELAAVLVFLYSGNDIVDSRYVPAEHAGTAAGPPRPTIGQRIRNGLRPPNVWLEQRSHAFKFFRDRGQFLRIRLGLSAHYFPFGLLVENAGSPAWGVTAGICEEIAELAEVHETPVLFVLLPSLHQVDRALNEKYRRAFGIAPEALDLTQPSRLLRREFAARGLDLVDLTAAMWRIRESAGIEMYGRVDTHLSPEGHRVVAELLERPVVELLP